MSEDIRINVTKSIIRESLMHLLKHGDVKNISVKILCAEANISRTTFYRYYQCVDDIVLEIEKLCVSKLSQMVRKEPRAEADKILFNILESIKMSPDYLRIGLYDSERFNCLIEDELYPYVKQIMSKAWEKKTEEQKHVLYSFIVYGVNGVVKKWIESGFAMDSQTIVREIKNIKF